MPHHADDYAKWQPATRAIALGRPTAADAPLNTPLMPATSFLAGDGPGYSRAGNPTWESFEEVVGALEGGTAVAFGSGMAAIAAAVEVLLPTNGTSVPVVACPLVHYSGSRGLLRSLAEHGRLVLLPYDPADTPAACEAAAAADVVLIETPANPTMDITDIAAVCRAARAGGARVLSDNTYATPLATRPLALGADIVIHSASKYLAGHSDALIGVAIAGDPDLAGLLVAQRTMRGAAPGVLEAWLATRGVRTLALRFAAACANAETIARRLAAHPEVVQLRHPSLPDDLGHAVAGQQMAAFGAMIAFRPTGGADRAQAITTATRLWLYATSLGGVESTLERRRRHTDESPSTPVDLIRLSVGCEDVEDLWADLAQALAATTRTGSARDEVGPE